MKHVPTILGLALGIVIGGYLLLFALQNAHPVTVDLVVTEFDVALYAVTASAFLAGFGVASLLFGAVWLRGRRERRALSRRNERLEEEVRQLRNAPIEEALAREEG